MHHLLSSPLPVLPTSLFPNHYKCKTSSSRSRCSSPLLSLPRPCSLKHFSREIDHRHLKGRCSSAMTAEEAPLVQFEGSLSLARACWVSRSLIAWNVEIGSGFCYLYCSRTASLVLSSDGVEGFDSRIKLEPGSGRLPANIISKFPHIQDYRVFIVPDEVDVKGLLKCQLAVASFNFDGKCHNATGLQLPGVLDDLFSYTGPLGAVFSSNSISLYLWAPTAQAVSASIYRDPSGGYPLETVRLKEFNGVWSANYPRSWEGCYYVYEVLVYHPSTTRVEKCCASDPYARGLSSDARRTFLVNLDQDDLKPEGWNSLADEKPVLSSFSDISIYELHIRDFSANDQTVNPDLRGGYLAFTSEDSAGIRHLKKLSDSGLTHVHLLPTFQFAGVADEKEKWRSLDAGALVTLPPDSDEQQDQVTAIRDEDGYNWGYNPVLWGVPKGSYASSPNGSCRTLEFRKMVQALNRMGLRVVLDVVYNHLHGSGPHDGNSVLDKVVPGYYLRLNPDGHIEHSTCVNNTASEHFMVERLIIDDLLCWAVNYKVDGFRFDLMGHIMKSTMVKAHHALHSLSKERNGVDGSKIYMYGEGWDFGEVAKNGRGINASQFNLPGTKIGSFNDRIRDAVLGGSPFGHPLQQGFATGLSFQPNGHDHGAKSVVHSTLATLQDHIQVGMAANLSDFVLTSHQGVEVKGSEVLTHGGLPVGYASCPTETAAIGISIDERCRINHLASSIIAYSQGIPFFHCGDEILRSKSFDRDSYNSGDWFNRLDFRYESNNWGAGLPPKEKNENSWPLIKPRLSDPSFKPCRIHIMNALENFCTNLRIRYSSPLFRLRTANAIQERVRFHNTGPSRIPGIIVMSIEDGHEGMPGLAQLDPVFSYIVILFNALPTEVSFVSPVLRARNLQLHPMQLTSSDRLVKKSIYEASSGSFNVPPRTTSVFVETRAFKLEKGC